MEAASDSLGWRKIVYLYSFMFFVFGTISLMQVYYPVYLQVIGFDKSAVGMIMAGGPIISVIANPFWGQLSDRLQNIRRVILILLTGNLVTFLILFQLDSFMWIYVVTMAFFLFQTSTFSQSSSLILNVIDGKPHKFGSFRSWGSIGYAVAVVSAAPILVSAGIGNMEYVYFPLMIVTILLCLKLPRGDAGVRSGSLNAGGYRYILRNRFFVMFLLLSVFVSIPNALNSMFIGLYVIDLGGSEWLVGSASFLSAILEVPVFLLMDRYFRKGLKGMLTILVIVCLLYALRWALMSQAEEAWHVVLIQSMQCISFGVYYYVGTGLTSILVPPEYRASGQALYTISWTGVSGIIAGFIGGRVMDGWGYHTAYGAGVVFALFSAIAFFAIRIKIGRRLEESII